MTMFTYEEIDELGDGLMRSYLGDKAGSVLRADIEGFTENYLRLPVEYHSFAGNDLDKLGFISDGVTVNTVPDGFFRKNQQSPLPTAEKYDIIISSPIPPKGRQLNEQNLNRNSKLFSQRTPGNRNNRNAGQNNHKAEISYPFL